MMRSYIILCDIILFSIFGKLKAQVCGYGFKPQFFDVITLDMVPWTETDKPIWVQ